MICMRVTFRIIVLVTMALAVTCITSLLLEVRGTARKGQANSFREIPCMHDTLRELETIGRIDYIVIRKYRYVRIYFATTAEKDRLERLMQPYSEWNCDKGGYPAPPATIAAAIQEVDPASIDKWSADNWVVDNWVAGREIDISLGYNPRSKRLWGSVRLDRSSE